VKFGRYLWRFRGGIVLPKSNFFGIPYFGPYWVLRPEIFTHAIECPSLASLHLNGDGGSRNNFFSKGGSKIGL